MKNLRLILRIFSILLVLVTLGLHKTHATQESNINKAIGESRYIPNEVLVKFKNGTSEYAIRQSIQAVSGSIVSYRGENSSVGLWAEDKARYASFMRRPNLFLIRVPAFIGTEQTIRDLTENINIEYAEKNHIFSTSVTPNDTSFAYQWGLNNTGQSSGTSDADIDAPEAWETFTGSSDICIAIVDTGIDLSHPDLQSNIWENPGETGAGKETDNIDNDGNGYIDDWRGWDFFNSDSVPQDDNSHGTHVAGITGAESDNNIGVAGVCWNSKLMALKAFNAYGDGSTAAIISAIDYAIEAGAQVINASFSSNEYSSSLKEAIEQAQEDGVLIICAASNNGTNNNTSPRYPASYDLDNIIAVLSTDHNDNLSSFSNYGSYSVDLGAPGGTDATQSSYNVYSSIPTDSYHYKAGTSMATPFVTGAIALILGQRPTVDWWQAKTIILKSVDYKPALAGKARTSGRLNLNSAVNYTTPVLPSAPTDLAGSATQDGDFYDIELTWTDNSNNESGFRIYMLSSTGIYSQFASTGQNVTTYLLDDVGPGTYYLYVRAYRSDGESIKSNNVSVHTY